MTASAPASTSMNLEEAVEAISYLAFPCSDKQRGKDAIATLVRARVQNKLILRLHAAAVKAGHAHSEFRRHRIRLTASGQQPDERMAVMERAAKDAEAALAAACADIFTICVSA